MKNQKELNEKLFTAALENNINELQECLAQGADVNAKNGAYSGSWTALMVACANGHIQIANILIENGADVNISDNTGETALMVASANDNLETIKLLIQHGADVNTKDIDGETALMVASQNGHIATINFLVENGADVNAKDSDGWTALDKCEKHIKVKEYLSSLIDELQKAEEANWEANSWEANQTTRRRK